jgi:nucleoside 2-deoxyribosyltransferase
MPFNNSRLDSIWLPMAREAVKATGFDLRRVDDQPEPGIIDNIMRVQIEEARFVVVELTGANLGAHWEAGYAEGLRKPVIYSCHRDEKKIHFDTSHLTRIPWHEDQLESAAKQLKAMIRHMLPDAVHEE